MPDEVSRYLAPGRLADVLALIQLLAFDDSGYRKEGKMFEKLGRKPLSASSWMEVAKSHPEFFRVRTKELKADKDERAALIIRYIVGKQEQDDKSEERPPLSTELAAHLFQIAINLHDKQVSHRDRWKPAVIALAVALIGLLGAVLGAYIKG